MFETRPATFAPEPPLTDTQESILHSIARGSGRFTTANLCTIYAPNSRKYTQDLVDELFANGFITFGEKGWELTPAGEEAIGN